MDEHILYEEWCFECDCFLGEGDCKECVEEAEWEAIDSDEGMGDGSDED